MSWVKSWQITCQTLSADKEGANFICFSAEEPRQGAEGALQDAVSTPAGHDPDHSDC